MRPALELIALRQLIDISAQVEVQLTTPPGPKEKDLPILAILAKAREEASDAIVSLCEVDPENAKLIRTLQNTVARFKDLVTWLRAMVIEGHEADLEMSEIHRDELQELVLDVDEETMTRMGLRTPGAGSE